MHTQVRRALAPLVFLLIFLFAATSAQAATFAVTYTNAAGQGFFDPTVGAARRAAFEASLSNWSQHLGTSPVPINVKASFDSLGGSTNSATLGQASPTVFFHDFAASDPHYQAGVYYAKALANISDGSIPSINQVLMKLFPSRGNCYVADGENMTLAYTFAFTLTPVENAIVSQSGVLPKTVGVAASVVQP